MGYTKKWTPPTIPLRDDLAAWKTLFQDLHQNLLDAGLVQSATPGQLDISAVSVLPADGTYAGFIEYEFNDALQATAPVVIKLEYGCGREGIAVGTSYGRSRTPRILVTVLFCGATAVQFGCPQSLNGAASITSQLTTYGASTLCLSPEYGFLGVVYGAGSRNTPHAAPFGDYIGATLSLFVQRSLDASGSPTADALYVYSNGYSYDVGSSISNFWVVGVTPRAVSTFAPNAAATVSRTDMAPRVGRLGHSAGVDEVLLEPIFVPSSPAKAFPFIASYRHTDISAGSEFAYQPLVGPKANFIALGRETCMSIDSVDGQNAGIAMLFE